MTVVVRPARIADAAAVGRVNVSAWQAAYAGLLPAGYLAGLRPEDRAEYWRDAWVAPAAGRRVLVADDGGDVVGFATSGPTRDPDLDPAVGELSVLKVQPDHWGVGIGGALLAATLEALAAHGHRTAALWVLTGNTRARAIYEHLGWRADGGERAIEAYGVTFEQIRYRREL